MNTSDSGEPHSDRTLATREAFLERAAIMTVDGGLLPELARRIAFALVYDSALAERLRRATPAQMIRLTDPRLPRRSRGLCAPPDNGEVRGFGRILRGNGGHDAERG